MDSDLAELLEDVGGRVDNLVIELMEQYGIDNHCIIYNAIAAAACLSGIYDGSERFVRAPGDGIPTAYARRGQLASVERING